MDSILLLSIFEYWATVSDSLKMELQVAIHLCICSSHKQFCMEGTAEMEIPEYYQDDVEIFADV